MSWKTLITMPSLHEIRMNTSLASEVLSSLQNDTKCDCEELLSLTIQGLILLQTGKGGKVRTENKYAYFDADFWESKVYVNIRLKQEHWSDIECLKYVFTKLCEMGYTKQNGIETLHFDNRIHMFIPYKKPGYKVEPPGTS